MADTTTAVHYLDVTAFAARLGVSGPTLIAWLKEGRIPQPDVIRGKVRRLWLESTVERAVRKQGVIQRAC